MKNKPADRLTFYLKNPETEALLVLLVLCTLFIIIIVPDGKFLKISNIRSMAQQIPDIGILTMAMTICMLSGGINLSIISTANLSGILGTIVMSRMYASGYFCWLCISVGIMIIIIVSVIIGIINGLLISYINVSPILATIGTMLLFSGISIGITRGNAVSSLPPQYQMIGNGVVQGIPIQLFIFIAVAVIITYYLMENRFGRYLLLIGRNMKAVNYAGINVKKIILFSYLLSGLLCGIAAVIMTSRFNSARAGYGSSYLLTTILIAVIGGVDPNGGKGRITDLILALLILQVISSGFNLFGISAFLTSAIWGVILILILGFKQLDLNQIKKSKFISLKGRIRRRKECL